LSQNISKELPLLTAQQPIRAQLSLWTPLQFDYKKT
jgi:hypothetical protein